MAEERAVEEALHDLVDHEPTAHSAGRFPLTDQRRDERGRPCVHRVLELFVDQNQLDRPSAWRDVSVGGQVQTHRLGDPVSQVSIPFDDRELHPADIGHTADPSERK